MSINHADFSNMESAEMKTATISTNTVEKTIKAGVDSEKNVNTGTGTLISVGPKMGTVKRNYD